MNKNNIGQEIPFNFEVEKNAIVGLYSCGAWFNGEYYIIDTTIEAQSDGSTTPSTSLGFIRKVKMQEMIKNRELGNKR